ncbi:MAG: zinc-ribbon domain-containing protein [Lachnospiraceae bacterium]|nr:zinc-ribbon domain-containing protein [Lachnospiraceae bacterium]
MGFLDNMGKTISDASQGALKKGKDMADVAKFNSLINDEEKKITGIYEQIGKKYVEVLGESADENFKELLDLLKASQDKVEEYRNNVKELKGVSNCPTCGAEVANNALFCAVCGTKMAEPAAEPVAAEVHCADCGAVIAPGSKFCTSCGKPV